MKAAKKSDVKCFHCGTVCSDQVHYDEKLFCCQGCKVVYSIFKDNGLDDYYTFESTPGNRMDTSDDDRFLFLENKEIAKSLLNFSDGTKSKVIFSIPEIHCTSCIWLLENIAKICPGVIHSEVNFIKKQATITFFEQELTLRQLALTLANVGYAPMITSESSDKKEEKPKWGKIQIQLGIAGFCFGNVMLLSFPEYLGFAEEDPFFITLFSWLNMFLSIPVLIFSAKDYLISAYKAVTKKFVSIDIPIALGILTLFIRSSYEVISGTGAGFFDSFTGLIFFLLIGKWFQSKTYESLSFERDYKSYFPLAVSRWNGAIQEIIAINEIEKGDKIRIRNNEIIPADCRLISESANVDYSFVTGENHPVSIKKNDFIYAGGKLLGIPIDLEVEKKVDQSYLTSLWEGQQVNTSRGTKHLLDRVSKYFTITILLISLIASVYWYITSPQMVWTVISAVLIVACPCALALSVPFTYGSIIRSLGRMGYYLKSADVVEKFFNISDIIFDKTGTLTFTGKSKIEFEGDPLTDEEINSVFEMTSASVHPYSQKIASSFKGKKQNSELISSFSEIPGSGIKAVIHGMEYRLGTESFVLNKPESTQQPVSAQVFFSVNYFLRGKFLIGSSIRSGLNRLMVHLEKQGLKLALLSGDNESDKEKMTALFPEGTTLKFGMKPDQKLEMIANLQAKGKQVIMIGDGLNDAPSLLRADIGISVVDNASVFSPASDVIIDGSKLYLFSSIFKFINSAKIVVGLSIIISFLYNIVGIWWAVNGQLTPVFAAILMPLSSITVVVFTTLSIKLLGKLYKLEK